MPFTVIPVPLFPRPLIRRLPPPTSTPVDSFSTWVMFRRAKGSSRTFIESKLSRCSDASVLTSGGRPSTVIVSVRLPNSSMWFWRTTWEAISVIPVLW